jgi:hypothetical protein
MESRVPEGNKWFCVRSEYFVESDLISNLKEIVKDNQK